MASSASDEDFFGASTSPGPPPLLDRKNVILLALQGFLPLPLPGELTSDLQRLFQQLESFYDQSVEDKKSLYPEKLDTEFGYYHVEGEKEYLTLRCRSSSGGDRKVEDIAARVWEQAGALMHRILCDIARANNLPGSIWDQMLDGTLTLPDREEDMTGTLLRMFKYFPGQGFAGEHTDLGLLTLCVGTRPGLQCLIREENEKRWIDAGGPVVLMGQTLSAFSDGLIRPGVHKVVPSPDGRFSVVYTLRHSYRHQIDLQRFGGEGTIDPKELWQRLNEGFVNINARADLRDKQRRQLAEKEKRPADLVGQG